MRPPDYASLSRLPGETHLAQKPPLETYDGLASYLDLYPRPVTIQHWQLRDLVHCPYTAGEVFAVHRRRVLRHDLVNSRTTVACDLSFDPTSFTLGSGFLAAGGQNSQLDIRRHRGDATDCDLGDSDDAVIYKGHCGGSVNNALRIARDASHQQRLFVCNNDDTIKVFSLRIGALITLVRCPVAINHCALAPCGHLMVSVGDNRHTYLHQATPSGYRPLATFTEASDAGMGCDWSPTGSCFAAASQDGLVCVWDARKRTPVAKFTTQLACRNVQFSPAPLDLLAFTEHRGRCHVADARMWPRRQVIHVSGVPELEPDISGLSFSPCGGRLYVGREDCIMVYDIDTGARRSFSMVELC